MVLLMLDLLKCHLVLAIKDKSINGLLNEEAKELRKLLIQLIDLPLSEKLHEVFHYARDIFHLFSTIIYFLLISVIT